MPLSNTEFFCQNCLLNLIIWKLSKISIWNFVYMLIMTRSNCKTMGIILKAIFSKLCPFLTNILSSLMASDRQALVPHVGLLFFCYIEDDNFYDILVIPVFLCPSSLSRNIFVWWKHFWNFVTQRMQIKLRKQTLIKTAVYLLHCKYEKMEYSGRKKNSYKKIIQIQTMWLTRLHST